MRLVLLALLTCVSLISMSHGLGSFKSPIHSPSSSVCKSNSGRYPPVWHRPSTGSGLSATNNASQLEPKSSSTTSSGSRSWLRRVNRGKRTRVPSLGEKVVKMYVGYCRRLWRETSVEARQRIAQNKAIAAIERVQHLVEGAGGDMGHEYWDFTRGGEGEGEKAELQNAKAVMYVLRRWKVFLDS